MFCGIKFLLYSFYKALENTVNDDGVEHAGYMSFMVLLSLFPFLVFFLALTSIFDASNIGSDFIKIVLDSLPNNSTDILRNRVRELVTIPPQRLLNLAIIGTIWTASSFVEGLRTILNKIYKKSVPPPYILRRLLSILQFLLISIAIFITMLFFVMFPNLLSNVPNIDEIINLDNLDFLRARYILMFLSLSTITTLIYYFIPNIKLEFKEVVPGACLTSLLWLIIGYGFSKYIIYYTQLNLIYGSLGSIIATLLFFYIINVIFIYGAEFNYVVFEETKH